MTKFLPNYVKYFVIFIATRLFRMNVQIRMLNDFVFRMEYWIITFSMNTLVKEIPTLFLHSQGRLSIKNACTHALFSRLSDVIRWLAVPFLQPGFTVRVKGTHRFVFKNRYSDPCILPFNDETNHFRIFRGFIQIFFSSETRL